MARPSSSEVPTRPFHETIVTALENLIPSRGAWPVSHARTLIELLRVTTIPTSKIPELVKRLVALRRKDRRISPFLNPVLRRLRRDHRIGLPLVESRPSS